MYVLMELSDNDLLDLLLGHQALSADIDQGDVQELLRLLRQ